MLRADPSGPPSKKRMNDEISKLSDFFSSERERVLQPSTQFQERMSARLRQGVKRETALWESIAPVTRTTWILALAGILLITALDTLVPREPNRGPVRAYLDMETSSPEHFLYDSHEPSPTG